MSGKYPDTIYRVSTKALIFNDKNEILVIREGDEWTLPGGGIDHGETDHEALARELYEEALIEAPFTEQLVDFERMYIKEKELWQIWLIYKVSLENYTYGIGADADDVAFLDVASLKNSDVLFEQLVYRFATKHLNLL